MKKKTKLTKRNTSIMAFVKFIAFILPLMFYLFLILLAFPAPNSGFIALGILGSIVIGLGLVNIAGLIDEMYLGHTITAVLIACGSLCVIVSSVIMYTPAIYSELNEDHITFYFSVWSLLVVSGIYYSFFRHAISLDLQSSGMSKSNVKKKMEGTRNYWWYQCLKEQLSHQWIFWVNKLFTLIFPCVCFVQLTLGWWNAVFIGVLIALIVLLTLNFAMGLLIVKTWNQAHSDRACSSSIAILGVLIFPIAAAMGLIIYFVKYL